ncbi:MAG: HNH endonuclease [Phycisphaerales bacterium]|nr:HNH endonuclease [Phycisphaerales bacterium]
MRTTSHETYRSPLSVESFSELIQAIHRPGENDVITTALSEDDRQSAWEQGRGYCHTCGQPVGRDDMVIEHFGPDRLPTISHETCCTIREGMSSCEIAIAAEIGFWLMMDVQQQGEEQDWPSHRWRQDFEEHWIADRGPAAEQLLRGLHGFQLDHPYVMGSRDELVTSVRRMYINDRERPKYHHWNDDALPWDEKEDWKSYKKRLNAHYDRFKPNRKEDQRNRGTMRQSWKSQVWQQTQGYCHFCREEVSPTIGQMDHLVHHSKGGSAQPWNLLPIHPWCNRYRAAYPGSELTMTFLMGRWMLEQWRADARPDSWQAAALAATVARKNKTRRR